MSLGGHKERGRHARVEEGRMRVGMKVESVERGEGWFQALLSVCAKRKTKRRRLKRGYARRW